MSSGNGTEKFIKVAEATFSKLNLEFTRFLDEKGFSLIGKYKETHKKQMGISGIENIVPFLKFYFDGREDTSDGEYILLKVRISVAIKYEDHGQIRYMVDDNKIKWLKPLELTTGDEFYVHHMTGKLYEKRKMQYKSIISEKLYKRIYDAHISSVLTFPGVYRRIKIFFLRKLPSVIFELAAVVGGCIHWWLKGKRYTYDVIAEILKDEREDSTDVIESEPPKNTIDFFGYTVGVWTLTTYSIVVIVMFSFTQGMYPFQLPENNALASIYPLALAIFSIVLYDKILPFLLKILVKISARFSHELNFRGVKLRI